MKDLLLCDNVVVKTLNLKIVIWQTTSKNCTKVPAARAARLFFLIQPIRSLFSGVVGIIGSLIGWIRWIRKNNRAALAARFLRQFFDVVGQTSTWNFHIRGSDENSKPQQQTFHSLPLRQSHSRQASESALCLFCTTSWTWNNRERLNLTQSSISNWRVSAAAVVGS